MAAYNTPKKKVNIVKTDNYKDCGRYFLQVDYDYLGTAAGKLDFNGLRLYLYLIQNQNNYVWELNPIHYCEWLGFERYVDNDGKLIKEKDNIRKNVDNYIRKGISNLIDCGYLKVDGKFDYTLCEWGGLKDSSSNLEQNVPKSESGKDCTKFNSLSNLEQSVPEEEFGKNCAENSNLEQVVPIEDEFPDLAQIIPQEPTDAKNLLAALGL